MQIKTFTIPVLGGEEAESSLNRFLRGNKILTVEQGIVTSGGEAFWCFCVRYLEKGSKNSGKPKTKSGSKRKDYKAELPEAIFDRFKVLRQIRKEIAQEDAVPAFAVFADAELVELAKISEFSSTAWSKIKGIGPKKIEKYLARFSTALQDHLDEKSR